MFKLSSASARKMHVVQYLHDNSLQPRQYCGMPPLASLAMCVGNMKVSLPIRRLDSWIAGCTNYSRGTAVSLDNRPACLHELSCVTNGRATHHCSIRLTPSTITCRLSHQPCCRLFPGSHDQQITPQDIPWTIKFSRQMPLPQLQADEHGS